MRCDVMWCKRRRVRAMPMLRYCYAQSQAPNKAIKQANKYSFRPEHREDLQERWTPARVWLFTFLAMCDRANTQLRQQG